MSAVEVVLAILARRVNVPYPILFVLGGVVVVGSLLALPSTPAVMVGAALCFALRYVAIRRGWNLPVASPPQPAAGEGSSRAPAPDDRERRRQT